MKRDSGFSLRLVVVSVCLLLVFVMGLSNLKSDPLAFPEYETVKHLFSRSFNQSFDLSQTIESVALYSEQHGPLYFVLLNVWSRLTGDDAFTLRLLSLYFGLLTIAVVYRLALLTRDARLAVNAVLIATFMSFFIFYTHEMRMYTLLPFVSAWIVWSYWLVLSSRSRVHWWKWLSLFIGTALILYVHYFGIIVLASMGIYHLFFVPKNKHWFQISLVMIAGGLMFLPWLPTAIQGFETRVNLESDRLTWFESIQTILTIYSNGLWFIPIVSAGLILWNFKRLAKPHKYLLILTCLAISAMILVNEFTPIIVERRMRYTSLFTVFVSCSFAIGLMFIPKRRIILLPLLLIWVGSFFHFTASQELYVYTNRAIQNFHTMPHYQKFSYMPSIIPGSHETILSLHPTHKIVWRTLTYYSELYEWRGLIHIFYDQQNEIDIRSSNPAFLDLNSIASGNNAIWLIYNPQETNLQAMPVYTEWLSQHYKSCRRFLEDGNAIIDYYVRASIPCAVIETQTLFEVLYDNGTHLSNLLYEVDAGQLTFYFRWLDTLQEQSALSIQLFNVQGEKVQQHDEVIGVDPLGVDALDISMLDGGEYVAKLIVYDSITQVNQPGTFLSSQQRFEREIEIARFTVGND